MPSGFDQKQSLLERKKKTQSQQDKNGRVAVVPRQGPRMAGSVVSLVSWVAARCELQREAERANRGRKKRKQTICFFFPSSSTSLNLNLNLLTSSTPTKKKREDTSTPPPAFAPVPPPPHPTYDLLASIRAALEEDAGDVGDLTTQAT